MQTQVVPRASRTGTKPRKKRNDTRSSRWRQRVADFFPESLKARLPRGHHSAARHRAPTAKSEPLENKPTIGVEVYPLRIEGRRLEGVRRALRDLGLAGFDLIRLGSRTYAVREPVLGGKSARSPRHRRNIRSLALVTAWDGHTPRRVTFVDGTTQPAGALAEETA